MPFVTDTHSLVWHITDDPKLSIEAKEIFQKVDNFQDCCYLNAFEFSFNNSG